MQVIGDGDAGEDGPAVVLDVAGFAVHQLRRADDVAAKGRADGLMAEADAEDRHLAGHVADEVDGDAGFLRRAGAGGEDDAVRVQGFDLFGRELVVAADDDVGASSPMYWTRLKVKES